MFTVASLSGGIMNEVHIYVCLSYILHIFYNKQYLLLLLKITHANYLKQIRKNLSGSSREQFCKLPPNPPQLGGNPYVFVYVGGVLPWLRGEEERPREF